MASSFVPHFSRLFAPSLHCFVARSSCLSCLYGESFGRRYASERKVITFPKNFPRQEKSNSLRRSGSKKTSSQWFRSSGGRRVLPNANVGDHRSHSDNKNADAEIDQEQRNESVSEKLPFSERDPGLSGTFIIEGRFGDGVVEDMKVTASKRENAEIERQGGSGANEPQQLEDSVSDHYGNPLPRAKGNGGPHHFADSQGGITDSQLCTRKEGLPETTAADQMGRDVDAVIDAIPLSAGGTKQKEVGAVKRFHGNVCKQSRLERKLKIGLNHEVLYGVSPCLLALQQERRKISKAFALHAFKSSARREAREILRLLDVKGIEVHETNRGSLDKLSQGRPHQGICLEVSPLYFEHLSKISGELMTMDRPVCVLALDQILDPMNLGALMRSAYFLGVDKVVASKHKCCSLTPTVSKASSGITEVMPIYSASNMALFLQELSDLDWHIVGATNTEEGNSESVDAPILPCGDLQLTKPTVLVIGSEGFGLRETLISQCHQLVRIHPGRRLHPNIDSLNVSVATGIILHSLLVKR